MQKAPLFVGQVTAPPYASTTCDSSKAGMLQYSATNGFQGCNGSSWGSVAGAASATVPFGFFRALTIKVTGSTALTASADLVMMANSSGSGLAKPLSTTISTATSGSINGLDAGSLAASKWYYVYAVSDGTTTGAVLSTSASAPGTTILTTYPYYARIGAVRTSSGSALVGTLQYGRHSQYIVDGANLTTLPLLTSGSAGSVSTPTWVAVSVSTLVPPTASQISLVVMNDEGDGRDVMVAPNSSYGSYGSTSSPPLFSGHFYSGTYGGLIGTTLSFQLESTSIYWASAGGSYMFVLGWDDNL